MKRGFVTVATGDWYCYLAQNLAMSYKMFGNCDYPFYVITDKNGEKKLKKYFDGVVVLQKPYYTFMDKMVVYNNSPFEQTIFIDADSNIVSDISFLFDDFERNNSDMSCVGAFREINKQSQPNHFGDTAVNHFKLKQYIAFNGGIYYFRKSVKCEECLEFIQTELIPNYKKYQLKEFRNGQMADEPLYGLAFVVLGFDPLDTKKDIMKQVQKIENLSWNFKNRRCSFIWYGQSVSPVVLHFGTHNTYTKKYVYYNSLLKCKYLKLFSPLIPFYVLYREVMLLFIHMSVPSDRAKFFKWFKDHFTKDWIKYRLSKLKRN